MTGWKKLNLNLASHPLRNRRFFFAGAGVLTVALVVVAFSAGSYFSKYKGQADTAGRELARLVLVRETAQKEKVNWTNRVLDLSNSAQNKVDLINNLIRRKSFSWVEFFSLLEEALPASSYIASLSPEQTSAGKIDVRFKVVTQNLDELVELVRKLYALDFKQVSVINETKIEGQMLSEISAVYERTD
jgi:hypothetical protein